MDPMQVRNMQVLLRQHLEALELAISLGRQYEQTFESFTTQLPFHATAAPLKQASLSQPFNTTFGSRECEAELEMYENNDRQHLTPNQISASQSQHAVRFQSESEICEDEGMDQLHEPLLSANSISMGGKKVQRMESSCSIETRDSFRDFHVDSERAKSTLDRRVRKRSFTSYDKAAEMENDTLKTEGCAQRLRRNRTFNLICGAAIIGNAIWISIKLDLSVALQTHPVYQMIDNVICGWYFFELVIWFWALKSTWVALTNGWFVTHAIIVGLMTWKLWVEPLVHLPWSITSSKVNYLSFLSVLRLARIAKAARILESATETVIYTTAILKGIQSTAPLLCSFSVIVFVFAIAFRLLLSETLDTFATVPKAFHFLFWSAFASLDKNFLITSSEAGWLPWTLFVAYTLIGNLTVAKILTGVLLQVMQKLVNKEKEKRDTADLEQMVEALTVALDADGSGTVSREEFENLVADTDLLKSVAKHNVDVAGFIDFTLLTYPKHGELSVSDLVRLAKQFWEVRPVSVKDIMDLRKLIYLEMDAIANRQSRSASQTVERMHGRFDALMKDHIEDITKHQARSASQIVEHMHGRVHVLMKDHVEDIAKHQARSVSQIVEHMHSRFDVLEAQSGTQIVEHTL